MQYKELKKWMMGNAHGGMMAMHNPLVRDLKVSGVARLRPRAHCAGWHAAASTEPLSLQGLLAAGCAHKTRAHALTLSTARSLAHPCASVDISAGCVVITNAEWRHFGH